MVRHISFIAATLGVAFLAAACGATSYGSSASSSSGGYPGAATTPSGPSGPSATSTIGTRSTPLGQILVGGSGRTLYLFAPDNGTTPSYYNACAGVRPP